MLSQKHHIKRITCEHIDDIEVQEDSELTYYQVKSTTSNTLRKSEIVDSIRSFSSIESTKRGKYNKYVLVSNVKIGNFDDKMEMTQFTHLDNKIKEEISSLAEIKIRHEFLKRVYFMKGPALEDISGAIIECLLYTLKDENYKYDLIRIKEDLLSHVNNMCPGPTDLRDMKIINQGEKEDYILKHKTITPEIVNGIIEKNRRPSERAPLRRVTQDLVIRYNIMSALPTEEQTEKIHDQIADYNSCSEDDDVFRFKYLRNFKDYSSKYNLYKDNVFLDFLYEQIKKSNNKNIIEECLYILHDLILTSKADKEASFMEYVKQQYFPLLQEMMLSRDERYEYSLYKIEQIIEELKGLTTKEQICELYWNRIVNIVHSIQTTGIVDNALWNSINKLNNKKCKVRKEWLDWLRTKDEYSDIKKVVFKELSSSTFL